MNTLKTLRWILAAMLVAFALFYICLSTGTSVRKPYLLTRFKSELSLSGDYNSLITVKDTLITLQESISFSQSALDTFVRNQYIKTIREKAKELNNGHSYQAAQKIYLTSLINRGWKNMHTGTDVHRFTRTRKIPFNIGFFTKSKVLCVPLLFTSKNIDSVSNSNQDKAIVQIESPAALNYILSSASQISMIAREGLVIETYPLARRQSLLDKDNNEVFRFRPRDINGNFFDSPVVQSTTINLKLLNPNYNNFIGRQVVDWSFTKILTWTLTALVALFADKIKLLVLNPLVDKIFKRFKSGRKAKAK